MERRETRIRVDPAGRLEIIDPGWEHQELLRSIDPGFKIRSTPLPGFAHPAFQTSRRAGVGVSVGQLAAHSEERLWEIHARASKAVKVGDAMPLGEGGVSLLDLKIELAYRLLRCCRLCHRRCRMDRTQTPGPCGLSDEARVGIPFLHVAEESPINPSFVLALAGCGLRCRYCQQANLSTSQAPSQELSPGMWQSWELTKARSVSFAGGNPDESAWAILRFLDAAPPDFDLPIVWNCHGYGSGELLVLLDGVVDVYLPDFKHGSDSCAFNLCGVHGYPAAARTSVARMLDSGSWVIVRLLVLPGHGTCCHEPVLKALAEMPDKGRLRVSIRGQYCPDRWISSEDGELYRRPKASEVADITEAACALGLVCI